MQAGITGAGYCSPSSPLPEWEQDVVQLVLGFEVEEQRRVAMLLENCGGGEGSFQAVRAPVPHHTAKSPQRFSALLPVIGQVAKKGLDLARSPVFLNDGPFLGAKRRPRWRRPSGSC